MHDYIAQHRRDLNKWHYQQVVGRYVKMKCQWCGLHFVGDKGDEKLVPRLEAVVEHLTHCFNAMILHYKGLSGTTRWTQGSDKDLSAAREE